MDEDNEWYEVIKQKEYLFAIRERLDKIDPRFHTKYVNMYLINGLKKALLIDTGCGIYPLKPLINQLIGKRELIIINTHSHFDHRGSNNEFVKVYVHVNEEKSLRMPIDISFLKDSQKVSVKKYEMRGFILLPSPEVESLKEGDEFDLGAVKLKIYHTPGHSDGSISLATDRGELFTGDTAHYGAMFLPKRKNLPILLESLSKLIRLVKNDNISEIYPSHEQFPVGIELLENLISGISNIDKIWHKRRKDKFLHSWILEDEYFKYII
jgi:glyoxylase-like metal-dependent hydrolase (beta-lactamase superfamily II)